MIGAIIGDIVGSRFEFNNTSNTNFELFTPECSFTDDTICTIAIADAILDNAKTKYGSTNYKAALINWCTRYPNPMGGYGSSFNTWLHSEYKAPYNSFGNGSAMRVSPVAYAFSSLEEALMEAEKTASVTHNHPHGIKGAVAVTHLTWLALHGAGKHDLMDESQRYYPGWEQHTPKLNTFDETCDGTIPNCLCAFFHSHSFEDAIRKAITLGGDSDTIGAIVGTIAGAYYGVPGELIVKAISYLPYNMGLVFDEFYDKYVKRINERYRYGNY